MTRKPVTRLLAALRLALGERASAAAALAEAEARVAECRAALTRAGVSASGEVRSKPCSWDGCRRRATHGLAYEGPGRFVVKAMAPEQAESCWEHARKAMRHE